MSFGIIASLILSLGVAWYVLRPLFEPALQNESVIAATGALRPLLDAKERALRAIKDLELDYSMGKLSQEDFEQSKGVLAGEVAAILDQLKRAGSVI